jgi:hypothetical protein
MFHWDEFGLASRCILERMRSFCKSSIGFGRELKSTRNTRQKSEAVKLVEDHHPCTKKLARLRR